ncbi:MAG: acyl-CoA dehydrogenase family protein [Halieaceae bacterium]|jgi:alkylation response protein AidB-like acyl-CoA dehydrogenase|nr:acyl-CoA dehydrogenase family protein [Halieaceae bacterium]
MEFRFTEEQQMIRDTAEAFLTAESTSEAVRQAMATEAGFDAALWQRVCGELYWPAITIPEAQGGMGLGYVELAATLEQMGRFLFCSPFFASVCLAGNALLVAGSEAQQAEWLPRLIEGDTATLAFSGASGGRAADAVDVTFKRDGEGFVLNGEAMYVIDGHTASWIIVAARDADAPASLGLFIVPGDAAGLARRWLPTIDQTRKQAALTLSDVTVSAEHKLGDDSDASQLLVDIIDLATIALAAEQVGGAQQALDSTVAYMSEREQFGRRIASYQAVKHKAADMMVKAEAARSAVYYAACVAQEYLEGGPLAAELAEAASVAKAWCSDAYFFNAGCGIQLHGGVGFTWEYDIQLLFKRARASEAYLGNGAWHRERVAGLLLDADAAKEEAA